MFFNSTCRSGGTARAKSLEHFRGGLRLSLLDLAIAQRQDLQQGQGFLRLLVGSDVLKHRLRFPVLRDDQGFAGFDEVREDLGGIGLQIADRLDPVRITHRSAPDCRTEFSLFTVPRQE